MGCFKSKGETIFDKLDFKLESMGVEEFDSVFPKSKIVFRKWNKCTKKNRRYT